MDSTGLGPLDLIVVGAGSAGCVVASRLTEDPARNVLLIEEGPDFAPPERWPQAIEYGKSMEASDFMITFGAHLRSDQPLSFVLRGRIVGGSGAVNGGIFMRGVPEDYDSWGSPLWAYSEVLKYFRKLESDLDFPDSDIHGDVGPMPVQRQARARWLPHQAAFYEAAKAIGHCDKPDLCQPLDNGVGPLPLNRIDGRRVSAAMAYIDPHRQRPNLHLWPQSKVMRVLVVNGRAVGVEVLREGKLIRVDADQVVLSTGGLVSPQILVLSGIGPSETLSRLGIPVVADLAGVGQNVHDHPALSVDVATPDEWIPSQSDPSFQLAVVASTASGAIRNDIHIMPSFVFEDTLTYSSSLMLPVGSGVLEFHSADPAERPQIEFRYLEGETDRTRFRESVRMILDILAQPSMSPVRKSRIEPTDADIADDSALEAWIDRTMHTAKHTSGTCKMGSPSDHQAVVDYHGRVFGIEGLTIADLSIAPNVVRAPANATAVMIGERIADFLAT